MVLPPVTDLYLWLHHWWVIAIILLRRFLLLHGWPVVVWIESAEVAWAFVNNALARTILEGDTERFYRAEAHDPKGTCEVEKGAVPMAQYASSAFITDLGDGHRAIVLANLHRGSIKYDPELAQDRWLLQLAADAAHQARTGAYLKSLLAHVYPQDRAGMQQLYELGEAAVPSNVKDDLEALRRRVQERTNVVIALRNRAAIARGGGSGFTSERATELRHAVYARHTKAEGEKTRRGKEDPIRAAQFEGFLKEQEELEARHLPESRHPCRPEGMSVEAWREWFMSLDVGIEIRNSAAVKGKIRHEDGQRHYEEGGLGA